MTKPSSNLEPMSSGFWMRTNDGTRETGTTDVHPFVWLNSEKEVATSFSPINEIFQLYVMEFGIPILSHSNKNQPNMSNDSFKQTTSPDWFSNLSSLNYIVAQDV